jgi:hypothetical protein
MSLYHHSVKSHSVQCHSIECHSAQCHSVECHSAQCHSVECHSDKCHSAQCLSVNVILLCVILLNVMSPFQNISLSSFFVTKSKIDFKIKSWFNSIGFIFDPSDKLASKKWQRNPLLSARWLFTKLLAIIPGSFTKKHRFRSKLVCLSMPVVSPI